MTGGPWTLDVEVAETEVAIYQSARLVSETCSLPIDKLVLDTGLAYDMVVPEEALARGLVGDHRTVVRGVGDSSQVCRAAFVDLEVGPWRVNVEVVIVEGEKSWLIGAPLLRWFDLLLRTVPYRKTHLVGPERTMLRDEPLLS